MRTFETMTMEQYRSYEKKIIADILMQLSFEDLNRYIDCIKDQCECKNLNHVIKYSVACYAAIDTEVDKDGFRKMVESDTNQMIEEYWDCI